MLQRAGAVVLLTHSYQVLISALISAAVAIRIAARARQAAGKCQKSPENPY